MDVYKVGLLTFGGSCLDAGHGNNSAFLSASERTSL